MGMVEDLRIMRDITLSTGTVSRVVFGVALQDYADHDERGRVSVRVDNGDTPLDRRAYAVAGIPFKRGEGLILISDYRYERIVILGATLPRFEGDTTDPVEESEAEFTAPRIASDIWDDTVGLDPLSP